MSTLPLLLRVAGLAQAAATAANLPAARILEYRRNLAGTTAIFRQVFAAHLGWVVATLLLLAGLDLLCAEALAGPGLLPLYLNLWIAALWGARLVLQLGFYEREFVRRHRLAHVAFSLAFLYVAAVHGWAAAAGLLGGTGP